MPNKVKAYISGALTAAPDLPAARSYYARLAEVCRKVGIDPFVPHLQHDPENQPDIPANTVYERDLENLVRAHVIVAHIGSPSSGVGAELAIAASHGLPIIAIWRPHERVSRFLLGMLRAHKGAQLEVSDGDLDEMLEMALAGTLGLQPTNANKSDHPEGRLMC